MQEDLAVQKRDATRLMKKRLHWLMALQAVSAQIQHRILQHRAVHGLEDNPDYRQSIEFVLSEKMAQALDVQRVKALRRQHQLWRKANPHQIHQSARPQKASPQQPGHDQDERSLNQSHDHHHHHLSLHLHRHHHHHYAHPAPDVVNQRVLNSMQTLPEERSAVDIDLISEWLLELLKHQGVLAADTDIRPNSLLLRDIASEARVHEREVFDTL